MLPYEATLVVTLRLPISLDAEDREAAHSEMQARVAEARSAGALESVRVDDLVAILAHSDLSRIIPVRRVATHTEEVCEDRARILRRPLGEPVWHCFGARGMRHVGPGADPDELWQAASGRDVAAFRTRLPADWRSPAWAAASEHVRAQARAGIDGPMAAARRNEFLRGVRHAVELHGPPACYQHLWTDAFYGFRWALHRMEALDTPEHQRLVQLEVSGEIPIARMRTPNAGAVYCGGDHDGVPAEVGHSVWRCLWQATNRLGGSANRWRARAVIRQTDEQLQRALAGEFGLSTYSYSGPHGTWETNPGACPATIDPVFRQGILDSGRNISRTEWRHTFRGPELLRHVRALLRGTRTARTCCWSCAARSRTKTRRWWNAPRSAPGKPRSAGWTPFPPSSGRRRNRSSPRREEEAREEPRSRRRAREVDVRRESGPRSRRGPGEPLRTHAREKPRADPLTGRGSMSEQDRTVYVDVREGPAPATVPGDVVSALVRAANDDQAAARGIDTAALIIVRLGREAGEAMLRHLVEHDPALLSGADPLFADTLANDPELIVGPLAGTDPCTPV